MLPLLERTDIKKHLKFYKLRNTTPCILICSANFANELTNKAAGRRRHVAPFPHWRAFTKMQSLKRR